MGILSKEQMRIALWEYYEAHFGERETDIWYEPPANNVWVFGRDGGIITLKCHILSGKITEKTEKMQ